MGIEPVSLAFHSLTDRFFTTVPPGKPFCIAKEIINKMKKQSMGSWAVAVVEGFRKHLESAAD